MDEIFNAKIENIDLPFKHCFINQYVWVKIINKGKFVIANDKDFEQIIYISCNPETLHRDLKELIKSHEIVRFALFDQFAYTNHIESGVILKKTR